MGRAAYEIATQGAGLSGVALLSHLELGYDLLYLMRGAPVVYYGDEVGMIGTGGDQQARQDMFPTQVTDWQTQPRAGGPPIGKGSSFDVTTNPIEDELKQLSRLREENPALATGWTIPRYAKGGVLVVSRIDPATKREYVEAFNNGPTGVSVDVQTSTAGSWTTLLPAGTPSSTSTSTASGRLHVIVGADTVTLLKANGTVFSAAPPRPKLTVGTDLLSGLSVATATVSGAAPVSVAFAYRTGSGPWHRIDVDTTPPFRGFLEHGKRRRIQVVAVARSLDGRTAVSSVVPYTLR
jgi:hypothetical protein